MTNVLVFCEKWESGGVESFVTTMLERMDLTGLNVHLAACKVASGPYDGRLARLGIRPRALGTGIRNLSANMHAFECLLATGHFDVVHLNIYEGMALLYARAAKRAGVRKVIVHSHNTDLRPSRLRCAKLAVHKACTRVLGRYADCCWAPSHAASTFMFGSRSFQLVRNGIVPERFAFNPSVRETMRARLGIAPDTLVLGCVGRLCQQKNQMFLLDVLAQLPKAVLVLVGEDDVADGSHEVLLRERAQELDVLDRVMFCGRTTDPAPYYQVFDALCVPSTFEGLGIVAVEAQAAGLPVLASPAVPPEACVCELFHAVSLEADAWAVAMEGLASEKRIAHSEDVKRAGYDMRDVAAQVRSEYEVTDL